MGSGGQGGKVKHADSAASRRPRSVCAECCKEEGRRQGLASGKVWTDSIFEGNVRGKLMHLFLFLFFLTHSCSVVKLCRCFKWTHTHCYMLAFKSKFIDFVNNFTFWFKRF